MSYSRLYIYFYHILAKLKLESGLQIEPITIDSLFNVGQALSPERYTIIITIAKQFSL